MMYFIVVVVDTFPKNNLVNREGAQYTATFSPPFFYKSTVCCCYIICFFVVAPRIFTNAAFQEAGGRFHSCQSSSKEADGLAKFFIFPRKGLDQEWAESFVSRCVGCYRPPESPKEARWAKLGASPLKQ